MYRIILTFWPKYFQSVCILNDSIYFYRMKQIHWIPVVTTIFVFIVYLFTLSRDIPAIDAGELATVQYTLGIAHPTGYPLFTLLGYVWSKIPLPAEGIVKMNILSALFSAIGIFFLMKALYMLLTTPLQQQKTIKQKFHKNASSNQPAQILEPIHYWLAAVVGAGFAAFSTTYWSQSTGVEVYSLQAALFSAYFFAVIRFISSSTVSWRTIVILGGILGICFGNHMTSIFLLPGSLFLIIYKYKNLIKILKATAIWLGTAGFTSILLYLYLPLRASASPMLNWGNPVTWDNLIRHVSGKQYQVWMFSSSDVAKDNLHLFISNLPNEFSFIGIVFMIGGFIYLYRKHKPISIFLAITFLFCIFYAINYKIKDLLPYFLAAFISTAILISGAVMWIWASVDIFRTNPKFSWLALGIPLYLITFNYPKVDQSNNFHIGDYTKEALTSVAPDAIILTYQWDILISPALYLQNVEHVSSDVLIIDKELLRRSWYISQIENKEPDFFSKIEKEKEQYLLELRKFEEGKRFDAGVLQNAYEQLISSILQAHYSSRPIYIAPEVLNNEIKNHKDVILPDSLQLIPQKYFYRLSGYTDYAAMEDTTLPDIRFPLHDDLFTKSMKNSILTVLTDRMAYDMNLNKQKDASLIFRMIRRIRDDVSPPPGLILTD